MLMWVVFVCCQSLYDKFGSKVRPANSDVDNIRKRFVCVAGPIATANINSAFDHSLTYRGDALL